MFSLDVAIAFNVCAEWSKRLRLSARTFALYSANAEGYSDVERIAHFPLDDVVVSSRDARAAMHSLYLLVYRIKPLYGLLDCIKFDTLIMN